MKKQPSPVISDMESTAAPLESEDGNVSYERTSARAQKRRDLLKVAVSNVLERTGYRAMKVTDVTSQANVAVGLFYRYFPDLRTATCEVLLDFIESIKAEVEALPDAQDRFQAVYRPTLLWAQAYQQHPGLMRCLVQVADEVPEFEALWLSVNEEWTRRIAKSIVRQFPNAGLSESFSLTIAYALGSMIDGLLNELYVHRNRELQMLLITPEQVAELLSAIWYRALYMENPPEGALVITTALQQLVLSKLQGKARGKRKTP